MPVTLHPWIRLIDTNTNAKEQQICPSVSIQKRALMLVLWPQEWKKGRSFFLLFLPSCSQGPTRFDDSLKEWSRLQKHTERRILWFIDWFGLGTVSVKSLSTTALQNVVQNVDLDNACKGVPVWCSAPISVMTSIRLHSAVIWYYRCDNISADILITQDCCWPSSNYCART